MPYEFWSLSFRVEILTMQSPDTSLLLQLMPVLLFPRCCFEILALISRTEHFFLISSNMSCSMVVNIDDVRDLPITHLHQLWLNEQGQRGLNKQDWVKVFWKWQVKSLLSYLKHCIFILSERSAAFWTRHTMSPLYEMSFFRTMSLVGFREMKTNCWWQSPIPKI